MKKTALVGLWFASSAFVITISFILLTNPGKPEQLLNTPKIKSPYNQFAALPAGNGEQGISIAKNDGRNIILKNFLEKNKSPMAPFADYLVWTADRYQLDFRLIPAIAMHETNAGKKINSDSHNAWGFANGITIFKSWPDAIDKVAKTLRNDYIDKGLTTPQTIMPKYAPPSVEKGGPWAIGVQQFLDEME